MPWPPQRRGGLDTLALAVDGSGYITDSILPPGQDDFWIVIQNGSSLNCVGNVLKKYPLFLCAFVVRLEHLDFTRETK